ncbi:ThuA domain-containing protein [Telmatocola sphagniphila]|uniref:ThuA domain-containing protein n=1 Tax=Telmatocola sphagniphila TaxID=1123043 RepID=A0A8E6BA99_9BACT|nr:ThuA domain-containing protein [Telmatocola sphagniphila]QVL34262.1 ThuA domain-containing protein [Telmatocola sphagniphila]
MGFKIPLTFLLALVLGLPLLAEKPENNYFESPLPHQPFDKTPFRPIKIPDWVQGTTGVGYTLSGMDTTGRTAAVRHGVTISEMNFVDPFYPYYDSKLLLKRSPHVPLDRIQNEIAEYKKLGIRILGVYPPTLQGEVYEKHPDWRRITSDTRTIPQVDMKAAPYGGMLCLLGPYGDFFIDVLAEILEKHPEVDAFSFDGLHHGGFCYCEHCRKNYLADTGKPLPPKPDLNDPDFRRYQHWVDRKLEAVVAKAQQRLKSIKPEVALVTWTTNAGRYGHFLSLPRNMSTRMNLLFDAPDQEFWADESNRGLTVVPAFANAYAWAVTNHRVAFSEPYLMSHGNPYGKDSFPGHEIERRMMLALTHGAGPSIAVGQPKRLRAEVDRCLDEVQKRKPWLTHKSPEPWAALIMSDNTRTFYGRQAGRVEERYMSSVFGTFRATLEEHLPTTVVNDWNLTLEELKKYAVVILPNTASLDDKQVKALDEYVKQGGGLVASLDTSLFDEYGDPRARFALGNLLGVDYLGLPTSKAPKVELDVNFAQGIGSDYWEKRKNIFDFRILDSWLMSGQLTQYLDNEPVTFKGPAVRVKPHSGTKILATLQVKDDPRPEPFPAIISREYGKGRVVYFPAGIDAGYYLYSYPYQRLLLGNAIRWAAGQIAQPVVVKAPLCVQSTVMRQTHPMQNRLIVHLYNDVNTTGGKAFPNDDVPLREEVLPIHDIEVRFRKDYKLGKIRLEPEGIELEKLETAEGVSVIVPKLMIHSMVVAELNSP